MGEFLRLVGLDAGSICAVIRSSSAGASASIGIARALAPAPVWCADEPVSALDVSIQAQVLNLLQDLQDRVRAVLLFISHDLAWCALSRDRVAVMYLGKIVEIGRPDAHFRTARASLHAALLAAAPDPYQCCRRTRIVLKGRRCRVPQTRLRAAVFTHAARSRWTLSAECQLCATSGTGRWRLAISRDHSQFRV